MRFVCDNCQARYSIADERVENKIVKLRCQKCGAEITVRGPSTKEQAAPAAARPATVSSLSQIRPIARQDAAAAPAGDLASALTGTFDEPEEEPRETTRIASLSELEKIRKQAMEDAARGASEQPVAKPAAKPAAPARVEMKPAAELPEWLVLVQGIQEGPYTFGEIASKLKRGEINDRTYVWREGMAEWSRLQSVETFQKVLTSLALEPSKAPSPARTPTIPPPPPKQAANKALAVADLVDPRLATADATLPQFDAREAERRREAERAQRAAAERRAAPVASAAVEPEEEDLFSQEFGPPPTATAPSSLPPPLAGAPARDAPASLGLGLSTQSPDEPPRESTRVIIAAAGLVARKKRQRLIIAAAATVFALLIGVIVLDITGVLTIPALGVAYTFVGLKNPHKETTPNQFSDNLTDEERQRIRDGLLGKKKAEGDKAAPTPVGRPHGSGDKTGDAQTSPNEAKPEGSTESKLLADVFQDDQKVAVRIEPPKLKVPEQDLPAGISPEAITKVVEGNQKAVKFCLERALKRGQQVSGKLEVEFTINATGAVSLAEVKSAKFKGSELGDCVLAAVKTWKFPRFTGDPVAVEYPFILSAGM